MMSRFIWLYDVCKLNLFLFGTLRPDFTSNLVHGLPFRTPKFYSAPYGKINHRIVNLSYNRDVKIGPKY